VPTSIESDGDEKEEKEEKNARTRAETIHIPRELSPIDSRKLVGPKRFANSEEHRPFHL